MATDQTDAMATAEIATKNEEPPKLTKDTLKELIAYFQAAIVAIESPFENERFTGHQSDFPDFRVQSSAV